MAKAAAATAASTSLRPPSPYPPRLAVALSTLFNAHLFFFWLDSSVLFGCPRALIWAERVPRRPAEAVRVLLSVCIGAFWSTLVCAAGKAPEESLKKTIEVDKLIDMLREANPRELDQIVVENILAFDPGFWKDYEELAENVMNIVDRLVHKTNQKIDQSTDVLKAILSPALREGEDVKWPPRDPDTLKLMEKEISHREQEGQLDEGFLSEVNAQLRQAKKDGDKPGLQAMLQKVLQIYASKSLQKRSYAYKGGQVVVPEKFLESIIQASENEWDKVLLDGLTVGKGDVSPDELYAVINKRIERVLIRTEGGSYQQRILTEYLKEIQARAEEVVRVLQGPTI
ncbi:hypothetical protein EJB05_43658, partial [Eragrostis curvula]